MDIKRTTDRAAAALGGKAGLLTAAALGAAGALAFAQPVGAPRAAGWASTMPRFSPMRGMISGAAQSLGSGAADSFSSGMGLPSGQLAAEAAPAAPPAFQAAPQAAPRKIVRAANLSVEVADEPRARSLARAAALKAGAEISGDTTAGADEGRCATLTFRVAPERFDALLSALESVGRVTSRGVTTQNLSEEYVDLRSRLANSRKVETRLHELLAFKTTKLADVLAVERELERVGREIEVTEGRMKYIDALAASSVVTVTLSEPAKEPARTGLLSDVRNAVVGAFNTFLGTGLALLKLSCWLAAVALWVVPVSLLAWKGRELWGSKDRPANKKDGAPSAGA